MVNSHAPCMEGSSISAHVDFEIKRRNLSNSHLVSLSFFPPSSPQKHFKMVYKVAGMLRYFDSTDLIWEYFCRHFSCRVRSQGDRDRWGIRSPCLFCDHSSTVYPLSEWNARIDVHEEKGNQCVLTERIAFWWSCFSTVLLSLLLARVLLDVCTCQFE